MHEIENLSAPDGFGQVHSARQDAQFYSLVKMSDKTLLSNKLERLVESGFNVHSIYGGHTTAICVASEYGNEELVKLLLDRYEVEKDILTPDRVDHDTAIHAATIGGNYAVLCMLERRISNLNVVNRYLHTPLHHAFGKGRLRMASYWISRGADLTCRDCTGAITLHFAARNGDIRGLQLLQRHHQHRYHRPIDVNQQTTAGLTPLHYAAWNGKADAVEWLLLAESNLELTDLVERNTALHWAAMRGHRETVVKLVRAHVSQGVEVFKENKDGKTVLELLNKYSPIEELRALLQLVEEEGLLDMKAFPPMVLVKHVMAHGNLQEIRKLERSLHYAADKSEDYKTALRKLLLEDRLMIWLAKKGNKDSVPLLMEMERYLPGGSFLSRTVAAAFNQALLHKRFEFADALAKHEREHGKGRLPVWISFMKVHLTDDAGSLVDNLDKKNRATLASQDLARGLAREIPLAFWVFQSGRNDIAKFLKEQDVWRSFINEQGPKTGRTALHWAYKFDRNDIVRLLLEVPGCDPDIRDKYWKSPVRYAVERRREERQVYVEALNAIIVGATLIAAISFGGFVQPPLGYTTGGSPHVDLRSGWMKVFWSSNSFSFFLAMASALMALRGVLPMPDARLVKVFWSTKRALLVASSLLVGSMVFALIAFGSAGMVVLESSAKVYVAIPTTAGGFLCILTILWYLWGIWLLRFLTYYGKRMKSASGAFSWASEVLEPEQDFPMDNVKEPKYKPGPRYAEYPWEDGLDEVFERYQAENAGNDPKTHLEIVTAS